jgi:kynurenine 3-monooxygenase
VVELDRCLDDTGDDWAEALPEYERRRRDNTEAIARMALENFVEMRDKVASPVFRLGRTSSTPWSGRCPAGTCPGTSWCRSPPPRTRRCGRRVRRQHRLLGAAVAGIAGLAVGAAFLGRGGGASLGRGGGAR